ncbi:MAG: ClpXP protease specificity-enhancing factor [Gammaproteobacteria bacterium]|nr:MAG: ClpXP protease specificity-enhancing factor [Gammaproteobacteria bacterium]
MNSSKPYLLRALHEWIVDNGCTPHILVDVTVNGVAVPPGYAEDDRIVLNISPSAVRHLLIANESVSFNARFGGSPYDIHVPMPAIMGIYARENGQGMVFEHTDGSGDDDPDDEPTPPSGGHERPALRVVK